MASPILNLAERGCRDPARSGGKGAGLARLADLGFPVPPGFVLATGVFESCLRRNGQGLIDLADIPPRIVDLLCSRARSLGFPVAVRSSLVGEDGAQASMAGQLVTTLGVADEEQLLAAVRRCYESAFAPRLKAYREQLDRRENRTETPPLAVVIQSMQPSLAAGVAFSADPLTGERCVIIEAAEGEFDAVVSGRVDPCRWRVDARGVLAQYAAGTDACCFLTDERIQELTDSVRRIAADLRDPVDVEWCWDGRRFWFLQARPISTLAGKHILSNRLVSDMSPGLIKPLLWSTNTLGMTRNVFGRIFDGLLGPTGDDYSLLARRVHSRLYTDMTMLGGILVRVGMPPNFFEMMARDEKGHRPRFRPSLRQMFRLRRVVPFLWRHGRVEKEIRRFTFHQGEQLREFRGADWRQAAPEQLLDKAVQLQGLHGQSQWYIFLAALNSMVRKRILMRMVGRHAPQVDCADLIRGLTGLKALEPNRRLHELAVLSRDLQADQRESLKSESHATIVNRLAGSESGRLLLFRFEAFMAEYGFLSANGTDISGSSWVERPEQVWRLVARHQGGEQLTPAREAARIRRQARRQVRATMNPLQRRVFSGLLRSTVVYLGLRERVSLLLSEDAYEMRRVFLALGDRLVEQGVLREAHDIFYLYLDEIAEHVAGDLSGDRVGELVTRRRLEMAEDENVEPPDTFCGEVPPLETRPAADAGDFLVGIGGSTGVIQGRARIVQDPLDAPEDLGPHDILVVPFTDVGWTPLFAGIGGIVAETGGQLSHTAIVAREYNLPAVVNVPGVTRQLAENQPITVDGFTGRVYLGHVLDRKESPT
jgi:phosphohistidine swiveling domain-containing protein